MGYYTRLFLVDVQIKKGCRKKFKMLLKNYNEYNDGYCIRYFLESVLMGYDGFLGFKPEEEYYEEYMPDDEGMVPAKIAKWHNCDKIADLLKPFCAPEGMIIFHSIEGDGEAFGWEFDGKGRMREMALIPIGEWI